VFQILFESGPQFIDLNGTVMLEKDSNQIPNGDYLPCVNGVETAKKLVSSPFELI
tara:strand:+ start:427 stop:591 length:165 start_codon:yes stop_codon:yes gene_type:complete